MNGHHSRGGGGAQQNHGILLLEDLEDEDADFEYQTSYSKASASSEPIFNSYKNVVKHNNLQVPTNPSLKVVNPSHPNASITNRNGYMNGFPRRKSLSVEPPFDFSPKSMLTLPYEDMNGVNNAITVAPSRNSLQEPNVFAGGRINPNSPNTNKNHHHHKKHNHRKHKGRSKSPNNIGGGGAGDEMNGGGGSILDKIDNSILKNFGDWKMEDDTRPSKLNCDNNNFRSNNSKHVPYYIPKRMGSLDEQEFGGGGINGNLPKLFKNYDTVVQNTKQVLTDKSYKIAVSKDNNDPNSILSEAKRTLSRFGGNID